MSVRHIYYVGSLFSTFFLPLKKISFMKIKNLKISEYHHTMLKRHCNKNGLKMYKFIEKLIEENCAEEIDIYGE